MSCMYSSTRVCDKRKEVVSWSVGRSVGRSHDDDMMMMMMMTMACVCVCVCVCGCGVLDLSQGGYQVGYPVLSSKYALVLVVC